MTNYKRKLTEQEAISTISALRSEAKKPEDINENSIENILSSIEENSIEAHLKEQELFKQRAKEQEIENAKLKENLQRVEIINRKNEEENIQTKAELEKYRQAERAKKMTDFQNNEWNNFRNSKRKDLLYFTKIVFLTLLPILVGIVLKSNNTLNSWVETLWGHQWWIWGGLVLFTLIELFGRAYLFDKEKIKSGWLWLTTYTNKNKILAIKIQKFDDYKEEFNKTN